MLLNKVHFADSTGLEDRNSTAMPPLLVLGLLLISLRLNGGSAKKTSGVGGWNFKWGTKGATLTPSFAGQYIRVHGCFSIFYLPSPPPPPPWYIPMQIDDTHTSDSLKHSYLPFSWQKVPMYPSGQLHVKLWACCTHVALFWHMFISHSLTTAC